MKMNKGSVLVLVVVAFLIQGCGKGLDIEKISGVSQKPLQGPPGEPGPAGEAAPAPSTPTQANGGNQAVTPVAPVVPAPAPAAPEVNNGFGGRTECISGSNGFTGNGGLTLITGISAKAFCIENTIRAKDTFVDALSTCSGLGAKWNVCTGSQVVSTCSKLLETNPSDPLVASISGNRHWSHVVDASVAQPKAVVVGCYGEVAQSNAATANEFYRCCLNE